MKTPIFLCLTIIIISSAFVAAQEPQKYEFVPVDPAATTLAKEQISFTVSIIDRSNFKSDPNVWTHYEMEGKRGAKVRFDDVACQFPFFSVLVQNNSEQTLKLRGASSGSNDEVIVAIDDDQGNTVTAIRKEKMKQALSAGYIRFAQARAANPSEAAAILIAQAEVMIQRIPLLTEDATVLPGRKAKFYTCFEYVPGAADDEEVYRWFANRKELTLGFFDVPVLRDAAGAIQKKTSYQFAFKVIPSKK